jgi:multidrug efflux system membrane fusion protein
VLFTLPEDNLPAVSREMQRRKLPVDVFSRDDQTKLATGVLLTIDNQIDPQTGTGRLKAEFENHDHSLWPNQFVNARLLLETRKNAIVVPSAAIQRGPQGTYVYLVKPDKTAEMRTVTIGLTEGEVTAVDKGLSPGEQVVTDGADKLQTGSKVEIRGGGAAGQNAAADSDNNNGNNNNDQSGARGNPSDKRKRGGQQQGQPGQQQR